MYYVLTGNRHKAHELENYPNYPLEAFIAALSYRTNKIYFNEAATTNLSSGVNFKSKIAFLDKTPLDCIEAPDKSF